MSVGTVLPRDSANPEGRAQNARARQKAPQSARRTARDDAIGMRLQVSRGGRSGRGQNGEIDPGFGGGLQELRPGAAERAFIENAGRVDLFGGGAFFSFKLRGERGGIPGEGISSERISGRRSDGRGIRSGEGVFDGARF